MGRPARARGRHDTGAPCPSCNLAREAATLSLVTRVGRNRCADPVGETAFLLSPLGPRRLSPPHSHKVVHAMSQRKHSDRPLSKAPRPPRLRAPALTILNPNAAGIDVHSGMHM